jgi:hypothetical protein
MEKRKIESFEDLLVWQKGIALVKQIYLVTAEGSLSKDFGLRDQLRRAAVSIPTNIAEGFERSSRKSICCFSILLKALPVRFVVCCTSHWKLGMLIKRPPINCEILY